MATALALIAVIGVAAEVWHLGWLERTELELIDARFRLRGARQPASDDIVIVALDDRTRREFPELITQRREWARLVDVLSSGRPTAIGLDAFFSAPEINLRTDTVALVRDAASGLDRAHAGAPMPPAAATARRALGAVLEELTGDERLAEAVARSGRVVLGVLFYLENGTSDFAPAGSPEPPGLAGGRFDEAVVVEQPASSRPPRAEPYVTTTLPSITAGQKRAGFLNAAIDPDGAVRRAFLVIEHASRYYAPFALAMSRNLSGAADLTYVTGDRHVGFGDARLPVDSRGRAYLGFLGAHGTVPTVSAADLLSGRTPPESLADRLVFVGRTDTIKDRYPTPFDQLMPGIEIHATAAHSALHDGFLRRVGRGFTIVAIAVLGLLIAGMQLRRVRGQRAWVVGVGAATLVLLYAAGAYLAFVGGIIVDIAAPVGSAVFVALVSMTAGLATEGREKAQLRSVFSQYVERKLVDQIVAAPERAQLGGQRRELTVLFSDIRGFSRFSEGLAPEVLSRLLNDYLTPMTHLVMEDGGMLDKYIGDAIMAVYGAPIDQADHAVRACRTALAMQRGLTRLNEDFRARDLPEIAVGVGINSGPMSVGNMGSEARFDYTVMGDSVNLGSRLEGLSKAYRCSIIVGHRTRELVGNAMVFRELDLVRVPGRDAPERIYELLGTPEQRSLSSAEVAEFEAALTAYRQGRWAEATAGLSAFLERRPADGPAHVLKDRVARLGSSPPARWDGIFDHVSK